MRFSKREKSAKRRRFDSSSEKEVPERWNDTAIRKTEFEKTDGEQKQIEETPRKRMGPLDERVKELDCLYRISSLVQEPGISFEDILQRIVDLIPFAWQHPEIICARILLDDQEFTTENFREAILKQTRKIIIDGERSGLLEVCYLEEGQKSDEGPFLKREKELLNDIAEQLKRIIKHKRDEERIRHLNLLLQTNRDVNQLTAREKDRDRLLDDICDILVTTRGYRSAWVAVLDEFGDLVATAEAGFGEDFLPMVDRFRRGELPYCGQKAQKQSDVVLIEDPSSTCAYCPLAGEYSGRRAMTVTLEYGGEVLGVISVSPHSDILGDDEERSLFKEVAMDIAFALHSIEMEEKRRRMEKALRENEEKFRNIFEGASDCFIYLDESGRILDVNERAVQVFRKSREELLGKHFANVGLFSSREMPMIMSGIEEVLAGRKSLMNVHVRAKKGRELYLECSASAMKIGNEASGIMVIARDITEAKCAEESLRESEERFRSLFESATEFIHILDKGGVIMQTNPAAIRRTGYDENELVGRRLDEFLTPASKEILAKQFPILLKGGHLYHETEFVCKDGAIIPLECSASAICNDKGETTSFVAFHRDITDRKCAENALRESEERYSALVENATDGIVIIQDGMLKFVNTASFNLVGYTPDEMVGSDFLEFVTPEDREMVVIRYTDRLAGKEVPTIYEVSLLKKDGTALLVEVNVVLIDYDGRPADLVTIRDITERKKAEEALRESEARYRLLAENVGDVIWTTDMKGGFTYVTPSVRDLLGYTPYEVLGVTWKDCMTPDSIEAILRMLQNGLASEGVEQKDTPSSVTLELEIIRKDGSTVWTETKATFLHDQNGVPSGILGVSRDITESREMIENLEKANEELKSAQAYLIQSEKLASIGTLASGIAHEMNNPLATVMGYAEAILDDESLTEVKNHARKIVDAAERASDVVRWLSKHSREAKDAGITDINLNEVLKGSLETMKLTKSSPNIEVITDCAEIPSVRGNRNELQQMFVDLLSNSADAMSEDGGEIILSTRRKGGLVEVKISDTGVGIPEDHLTRIFDPFFTTKDVGEGTGLGLYVVSMIVRRHHGTIEVDSAVGVGTAFTLRFPTGEYVSESRNDAGTQEQRD